MDIKKDTQINLTVIHTNNNVGKDYYLDENNDIEKKTHGSIYNGYFLKITSPFNELPELLQNESAILLGDFVSHNTTEDYIQFGKFSDVDLEKKIIARTQTFCKEFEGLSLFLIDQDSKESFEEYQTNLIKKHPKIKELAYISIQSSSSGIRRECDAVVKKGGWHTFIVANLTADDRFHLGDNLYKRELIHTGFSVKTKTEKLKNSTLNFRTIGVDESVSKDASRICFNKVNSIGEGIVRDNLGVYIQEGKVLERHDFDLTKEETELYNKKYNELLKEREEYRKSIEYDAIEEIARDEKVTYKVAKKIFKNSVKSRNELSSDFTIKSRKGTYALEYLLTNSENFKKWQYCKDTIEPNYSDNATNLSRAKFRVVEYKGKKVVEYKRFTHNETNNGILWVYEVVELNDELISSNESFKENLLDNIIDLSNNEYINDELNKIENEKEIILNNPKKFNNIFINKEEDLLGLLLKYKNENVILHFKVGTGYGKTKSFINFCKGKEVKNISVFTPYISLCVDFLLKSDNFNLYSEEEVKVLNDMNSPRFVTTLDSAHKFRELLTKVDITFFDELSMIIERLSNGMMGDDEEGGEREFNILKERLNAKGLVVIADALLSEERLQNLLMNCEKEVYVIDSNVKVKRDSKVFLYENDLLILDKALSCELDKVFPVIFTGSIDQGEFIKKEFIKENENKNIVFFHSELKPSDKKQILEELNNKKIDCLITTQAIKTGVSFFTPSGKIGKIFNLDDSNNVNYYDIIQEINRLRDAVEINILLKSKLTLKKFQDYKIDKAKKMVFASGEKYDGFLEDCIDLVEKSLKRNEFSLFKINDQYLLNKETNISKEKFVILLKSQGYFNIFENENKKNDIDKKVSKEVKKEIKKNAEELLNAKINDLIEKDKKDFSELDKDDLGLISTIKNVYKVEELNEEILKDFFHEDSNNKRRLMYKLISDEDGSKNILNKVINHKAKNVGEDVFIKYLKHFLGIEFNENGSMKDIKLDRSKLEEFAKVNDFYYKSIKESGLKVRKCGNKDEKLIKYCLKALGVMLSNFNLEIYSNHNVTVIRMKSIYNDLLINKKLEENKYNVVDLKLKSLMNSSTTKIDKLKRLLKAA